MNEFLTASYLAFGMLISFDPELYNIIARTLQVSLSALCIALFLGLGLASFLAMHNFRGKALILLLIHALLSLPPVVVGLIVYILFSFTGPLGDLGWLFTPKVMIIAQVILILPIISAYSYDILDNAWQEHRDQLQCLGAGKAQSAWILIFDCRYPLVVITIGGFGRAISEVGAVMIVGGNILHHTRVMTTSITLAISRGELSTALALGGILMLIALTFNFLGYSLRRKLS